ncbi:limonene-1,2-epoxide hydrolase family protein [Nocardioides sp. Kera G14]|uniref:limonene-1,2-epoxide hydrolase family protein n=1 Tax=Nocardioides sp. Kera G14 TaxID=2884264 RepID=UPI001D12D702|nr:limonene-1,2-epoxide hydrolase family protein [Nocardioides sp. Kera G14]UDY24344.1 nuclear transport factor 2 family protein [Nocardioides sp. Kera G14]
MSDAAVTVTQFLDLLATGQAAEAVLMVSDDIEWRNTGLPTLRGRRVVDALLAMEKRGIAFSADMHHIASNGNVVLTDRTDHLGYRRFTASFWVCGTFALDESGKIVLWDDHFANGNVLIGTLKGLAGLFRRR